MKSKKRGQYKKCLICGSIFYAHRYKIKEGNAKYCSIKCSGKGRIGYDPWNKGVKGIHLSPETEWKKGIIPKGAVLFGKGQNYYCPPEKRLTGIKHFAWKGDEANQKTIHSWIKRHFGKAKVCEKCGSINSIGWANKYHTYKRKI